MGYGLSTNEGSSKNKDSDSISRRSRRMKKTSDRTSSSKKEAEYEVEGILDHARDSKTNGRVFLVKWKGFSEEDASWEPEENFKPELIVAYDKVRRQRRKLAKQAKKDSAKKPKSSEKPAKPSAAKKKSLKKQTPSKGSRKAQASTKQSKTSEKKSRAKKSQPATSSESEEYEVEKIIELSADRKNVLVKWKGFSADDASWEPVESVRHLDVYKKFKAPSSRPRSTPSSKKRKNEFVENESDSDDIVSWQPGESWEVEQIVASRQAADGGVEYFIKWKGWPDTSNTWEPSANVDSCRDALRAFTKEQQVKSSPAGSRMAQKKTKRG